MAPDINRERRDTVTQYQRKLQKREKVEEKTNSSRHQKKPHSIKKTSKVKYEGRPFRVLGARMPEQTKKKVELKRIGLTSRVINLIDKNLFN